MDKQYKDSIISYYDNTRLDYSILWFRKKNRSVHFGYYDEHAQSHSDALINLNRVMAQKINLSDGDTVLDAGCGQGGSSVWMAENYRVHVSGVSIVPHQIRIAIREAQKRGLQQRVKFYEKDYCNTGFPDASFSVIWACESMCHAQNKLDFYREAHRLLKPGGRLVCADYIRTARPHQEHGERTLYEWLSGWSIKDIDTAEEHIRHTNLAGFTDFKLEDVTGNTKPSLGHLHAMSNKLWKLGKFLKSIGLRNRVNHGNHLGSIRQYEALEQNLWHYGIMSMKKP